MDPLFLMLWALGALIGIAAAQRRGFSVVGGAIGGLLLGPLLAPLMFLISSSKAKCPHCAEWVQKAAKVCPHCQRALAAPAAPRSDIKTSSARRS